MTCLLPEVGEPGIGVGRREGRTEGRDMLIQFSGREIIMPFGLEGLGEQCTGLPEIGVRAVDPLQQPNRSRTLIVFDRELGRGKDLATALERGQPAIDGTGLAKTVDGPFKIEVISDTPDKNESRNDAASL